MTAVSKNASRWLGAILAAGLVAGSVQVSSASAAPTLTYTPGSSVKLYQVNGDCDWEQWDATIDQKNPTCRKTASQTATHGDILGDDVPVIFEHDNEMIVTFGDTFGANANRSKWTTFRNTFRWKAQDPIGRSTTPNASQPLKIDFFMDGDHARTVSPPGVEMGPDDVPSAGISLGNHIYLAVTTGSQPGVGHINRDGDYAVLVEFNESSQSFTTGRKLSDEPSEKFSRPIFRLAPQSGSNAQTVYMFGVAQKAGGVYLSKVPAAGLWTGAGTTYFSGLNGDTPIWKPTEAQANTLVPSPFPSTNPAVPYATVTYESELGLWIMIMDLGGGGAHGGMYMTYAAQPWGPWSSPQMIFNPCRDHAFGTFMYYYYDTANSQTPNSCPQAMNHGGVRSGTTGHAGPAGPTAGDQQKNVWDETPGIPYGPAIVDRFTTVENGTLKLYWMLSTWNPYAVVMMESDFRINCTQGPGPGCPPKIRGPNPGHGPTPQPQ